MPTFPDSKQRFSADPRPESRVYAEALQEIGDRAASTSRCRSRAAAMTSGEKVGRGAWGRSDCTSASMPSLCGSPEPGFVNTATSDTRGDAAKFLARKLRELIEERELIAIAGLDCRDLERRLGAERSSLLPERQRAPVRCSHRRRGIRGENITQGGRAPKSRLG